MKLKSLLLTLLVMFSAVAMAQVESGKVYRIVSSKYGTVITASPISHALSCVTKGSETDYQQMWEFTENNGKYSIKNVFSRRYLQNESGTNVQFKTGSNVVWFAITENATLKGDYNIDASGRAGGWGLHCDSGSKVVPWSNGPNDGEVSGTEWTFEEVSLTDLQKDDAYAEFVAFNSVNQNKATITEKVNGLFADKAGTQLKADYATMTDDELVAVMDGVPADLQQAVLKVKNNSWATQEREHLGEKNFRIFDYKPYSDPDKWKDILYHRPFSRINNPTGINSISDKGFIYVFVNEIPEGTTIYLSEMNGTAYWGTDTQLTVGLNIVPSAVKDGVLYIRYICDTHTGFSLDSKSGPKKLSDYPAVKIHIEGGYVNGFWSKERGHNNDDWKYMAQNMFSNPTAVQAVGDHSLLDFRRYEFLKECNNIEGIMSLWDFWNERQRFYMGLNNYYDYFNNKQLAMSDDGGFMDAGNHRTHYNNNTLNTIVNYNRLIQNAGDSWGPNHEIGHTNQYAFELVGTSEVSNNALANFAIFDQGTHTSRGNNLENQILDFENNVPYVLRGEKIYGQKLFSMTRMYFQLFLYFHAAGKKTDFYPALFEDLRRDKLVGWSTTSKNNHGGGECNGSGSHPMNEFGYVLGSMDAKNDQLKFVEKCCSIAQVDLTEFFEAWGFFIPMKNAYVGDYGHHHVYLTQGAIDSCKARIKAANYPKKGGHLMFLEDRVRLSKKKVSPFSDGNGYRADYSDEAPVANNFCGLFGQWEDYVDESVVAHDYYYAVSDGYVTIIEGKDDNNKVIAGGALGFKLYDADTDKLITYTNRLSMKIPNAYLGKNYRVVAAQANGEDAEVLHASKGPESMQYTALKTSLDKAEVYTYREAVVGNEIGYFYPDSLAYLRDIFNQASKAYKNKDTSAMSYAEWSILLDNECRRLVNTEGTRVMFEEGMEVNIYSLKSGKKLRNSSDALVESQSVKNGNAAARWSIEYTGEAGVYYLKTAEGYYVKDFEYNDVVYADIPTNAGAARFTLTYTDDGNFFFTKAATTDMVGLGASDKRTTVDDESVNIIIGKPASDSGSMWYGFVYNDNSKNFYKQELDNAMEESRLVITEVLNLDSIGTMNIFNNSIVVKDRNLETYVIDLYNHYLNVLGDSDNEKMYKNYLATFRELLKKIDGTYIVTAPIATKGDRIAWYRLCYKEDGNYLGMYSGNNSKYKGRLAYVGVEDLDDNALWAFASTGRSNEYKIYNCGYNGYISNKDGYNASYMFVTENSKPFVLTYNADEDAVAVSTGSKYLRKSNSYVNLGNNAAYWTLELVALENDKDLADIITVVESVLEEGNYSEDCYDLSGRKVLNPEKGIYIQNGKKVFFK